MKHLLAMILLLSLLTGCFPTNQTTDTSTENSTYTAGIVNDLNQCRADYSVLESKYNLQSAELEEIKQQYSESQELTSRLQEQNTSLANALTSMANTQQAAINELETLHNSTQGLTEQVELWSDMYNTVLERIDTVQSDNITSANLTDDEKEFLTEWWTDAREGILYYEE